MTIRATVVRYRTVHYFQTQPVTLSRFSVKLAYWCLVRKAHGVPIPKGQGRWAGMPFIVEWPVAWCSVRCDSLTKKQEWRAYKLMHFVGSATVRLCSETSCFCGEQVADLWHGIFDCHRARALWSIVEGWWGRLGGSSPVSHPMCKITLPNNQMRSEVPWQVWRLLCACMIDVLWIDWTRWVHEGVGSSEAELRREWAERVHESITVIWVRARRLEREYDTHVHYVPGCAWSQPKIYHESSFIMKWCGPLGSVVNGVWVSTAAL